MSIMLPETSPLTLGDMLGNLHANVEEFGTLCREDQLTWTELDRVGSAICDLSQEIHLRAQPLKREKAIRHGCTKMQEFVTLVEELAEQVGDSVSDSDLRRIQGFSENVKARCASILQSEYIERAAPS